MKKIKLIPFYLLLALNGFLVFIYAITYPKEIPNERYQEKEFDLEEFLRRRKQKATASSTASMPQENDMAAAIMREKFLGGNGKE